MGIENKAEENSSNHSKSAEIYRPPALRIQHPPESTVAKSDIDSTLCRNSLKTSLENLVDDGKKIKDSTNSIRTERLARRERRPDRAVYVPKAIRSQVTSPHTTNIRSNANEMLPSRKNDIVHKNDNILTLNTCDNVSQAEMENHVVISDCDENRRSCKPETQNKVLSDVKSKSCDNSKLHYFAMNDIDVKNENSNSTEEKHAKNEAQKNHFEDYGATLIEEATYSRKDSEEDNEISELERMSKQINRSSRRIIKQTFNSDVLEIPDAIIAHEPKHSKDEKVIDKDIDNDDWDSIFDENGDCLDPKILSELTASVGKVKIEQPKADYKAFLLKQAVLNEEEYPHVLEVSNFPVEFKTQDLIMVFSNYKGSGFDIKWVDDTHALAVFSSSRIAAEVLAMGHPFVLLKPLAEATIESRLKAKKCAAWLQPYRQRPETCAALARRLVTGALGVRLKTAAEERENEKKVLREAKERKLLAAKQRQEAWDS